MVKKKILFVMPNLRGGGAEKVLINVLRNFNFEKYDVDLLLIEKTGVHLKNVPREVSIINLISENRYGNRPGYLNVSLRKLISLYSMFFLKALMWMPFLVYRFKLKKTYDVEIGFLQWYTFRIVSNSPLDSKKIGWIHNDLMASTPAYCYERDLLKLNLIISVSNEVKAKFIERHPSTKHIQHEVIYNMLDESLITKKSLERIEIQKKKITLVSVGSLSKQKRFDRLIAALKILIQRGYDMELWLLGEGELKADLERFSESLLLSDYVKFLGYRENPYKYIRYADIFVCSSDFEGFPLVVGEAMILGVPIVTTDCTGPKEILDYGRTGLVVSKSEEALADGVIKILVSDQLKTDYIKSMKTRKNIFNPVLISERIGELIDSV